MISYEEIKQAELTGQYKFPYKKSFIADCVRNELITFDEFLTNEECKYAAEYLGNIYKYTFEELKSTWECVKLQRIYLKAILKVVKKEYVGINPALRSLGLSI